MSVTLSRRGFARAVGGAGLAAPWLPGLLRKAEAASAPLRLLVLWTPHGPPWEYLRPAGATGDRTPLTAQSLDFEHSILAPTKAFASHINILEGLSFKARLDQNTPPSAGLGHEDSPSAFLSGQPVYTLNKGGGPTVGPTLDQFLGARLASETPVASVVLGMLGGAPHAQTSTGIFSVDASRRPTAGLLRPDDVASGLYRRLFGGFAAPMGTDAAAAADLARRKGVLAIAHRQAERLRVRLSGAERRKLEQHLQALSDIQRKLGAAPAAGCAVPPKPIGPAGIAAWTEKWGERNGDAELKALVDVIVQGFACDRTRVMLAYAGMSGPVPWEPLLADVHDMHHEVAHVMRAPKPDVEALARRRMAWYMRSLARYWALLLEKLQSVPEGGGTLLDNTIVLWGTEFGDPSGHAGVDMGLVLFGGRRVLETGFHRKYPTSKLGITPHNQLLTSICHAFGAPVAGFGSPRYPGTLPGLLRT